MKNEALEFLQEPTLSLDIFTASASQVALSSILVAAFDAE